MDDEHTIEDEMEILTNILMVQLIDEGGIMIMPRSRWKGLSKFMATREYDEEMDVDVFNIILQFP
ncbi:MAG: hypothetical protein ACWGQW_06305 [bacterium]